MAYFEAEINKSQVTSDMTRYFNEFRSQSMSCEEKYEKLMRFKMEKLILSIKEEYIYEEMSFEFDRTLRV